MFGFFKRRPSTNQDTAVELRQLDLRLPRETLTAITLAGLPRHVTVERAVRRLAADWRTTRPADGTQERLDRRFDDCVPLGSPLRLEARVVERAECAADIAGVDLATAVNTQIRRELERTS